MLGLDGGSRPGRGPSKAKSRGGEKNLAVQYFFFISAYGPVVTMRSYMKVYVSSDFRSIFETPNDAAPTPSALLRYHKADAIANIGIFLQPGFAGIKEWRLYADQGLGAGMQDTGLVVPPEVFAFFAAYSLGNYPDHPKD
jgi:hypothetical protein